MRTRGIYCDAGFVHPGSDSRTTPSRETRCGYALRLTRACERDEHGQAVCVRELLEMFDNEASKAPSSSSSLSTTCRTRQRSPSTGLR
ncbi:hypothetical protein [Streptomyces sp. BBFR102]|uniref:hypothetical protein n=1 Tax=Streptomyces sp. BBFR102 TaxID=3448171 RepID=UPI003F52D969